jgi:hypothetical protein
MLPLRLQLGNDAVLSITTTSNQERADEVTAALTQQAAGEVSVVAVDWRSLLPPEPRHLLVRESFSPPTTLSMDGATSAHFRSPVPDVRCQRDPYEMHWMSDVSVDGWTTIDDDSLGSALLDVPHPGTNRVRTSCDGVSYVCPGAFVTAGMSLESQTATPRLRPLGLEQQLQAILAPKGWEIRLSDKGIYATQSAALFGGLLQLGAITRSQAWRTLLELLTRTKNVGPGHYQRINVGTSRSSNSSPRSKRPGSTDRRPIWWPRASYGEDSVTGASAAGGRAGTAKAR